MNYQIDKEKFNYKIRINKNEQRVWNLNGIIWLLGCLVVFGTWTGLAIFVTVKILGSLIVPVMFSAISFMLMKSYDSSFCVFPYKEVTWEKEITAAESASESIDVLKKLLECESLKNFVNVNEL